MKETLDRILARLKKWFILLILIPILAAGAAYLFQKEGPSSYTANAEIQLATFDKDSNQFDYTDAEYAKTYITSDKFIEKLKKEDSNIDPGNIKSKVTFVIKPAKVLGLSYTGKNAKEAKKTLELVVNQYINDSKDAKEDIEKFYKNSKSEAGPQKPKTKSEYDIIIFGLHEAKVLKNVDIDTVQESAKTKTVFGFLIGLMISFMILLLPEVFRK
ncbi:Wzz/FepE/Etk N-terminal domain-containing protein [Fictibacillus barbaricus]|uniref:Teichuronic acid biosynthesis protein TuaF n=1 Tax=Fictibacillus barbaricus TaxID=182136 RepID=A0ABU1U118_9BACL|nr:Wzz/FepE/Etk N-terminal domain-containing protein [Fictibacillus barbaricus]MDR7073169.1 teichuronic acid biosynthesis protein TuaF [Fictibacillus barbaricus]